MAVAPGGAARPAVGRKRQTDSVEGLGVAHRLQGRTTQESLESVLNFIAGWAYRASTSSRTKPRPSPGRGRRQLGYDPSPRCGVVRGTPQVLVMAQATAPSAVSHRSVSSAPARRRGHVLGGAQVFSGTSRPPPRWAMTAGRRVRDAAGGTVGAPSAAVGGELDGVVLLEGQPHGSTVDSSAVSSGAHLEVLVRTGGDRRVTRRRSSDRP